MQCACCNNEVPEYGWTLCDTCNDLTFQVSANAYQNNMSIQDTVNSMDLTDHQKEFLIDWFIPFKETM